MKTLSNPPLASQFRRDERAERLPSSVDTNLVASTIPTAFFFYFWSVRNGDRGYVCRQVSGATEFIMFLHVNPQQQGIAP